MFIKIKNLTAYFLKSEKLMFGLFLLCGGLLSILLKYEVLWDFANYHYYNPWAFVNDRVGYDIVVAGVNGFFNPLMDLPLYYLITYFNDYSNFIYFMQGLWSGLLAFLLYKTALLFFDLNDREGRFALLAVILLGMTGYAVFFQIGTCTNEIQVGCLIVFSVWLLLREIFVLSKERPFVFFVAGLSAGVAFGLKLTAVIYALPLGITLIVFMRSLSRPLSSVLLFTLGGFLGFAAMDGFWIWKMWQMYDNPFFPYLNKLFQSQYFEIRNYIDERFLPGSLMKYLFLPLYWFFNPHQPDGNVVVIDFRWGMLFLFGLATLIKHFAVKDKIDKKIAFLSVFMLLSYIAWISLFTIKRYMVPLEIGSAILIVKSVLYLRPQSRRAKDFYWQLVAALCFLAALTPLFSQKWGCRNCSLDRHMFKQFVAVDGVKLPENTLLMFYNYPSAALLPYFHRETSNIRGVSVKQKNYVVENGEEDMFNANSEWLRQKKEIIEKHQGLKVGVIAVEKVDAVKKMLNKEPYLKGMYCWFRRSNIIPGFYFCVRPDQEKEILING